MKVLQNILYLLLFFLSCEEYVKKEKTIYQHIPQNTFSLIQVNESRSFKELLGYDTFKPFIPRNNNLMKLIPIIDDTTDKIALICFSSIGKDKFSTTLIHEKIPDSSFSVTNSFIYSDYNILETKINETIFFKVFLETTEIISDSKLTIENIIRNFNMNQNGMNNEQFFEVVDSFDDSSIFNLLINKEINSYFNESIPCNKLLPKFNENWIALDGNMHSGSITLDGITFTKDSIPSKIGVYGGMKPKSIGAIKIIPKNFKSLISFPIENMPQLSENIKQYSTYKNLPIESQSLKSISSIDELSIIDFNKGMSIFVHKSNEINQSIDLDKLNKSYRNIKYGIAETFPHGISTILKFLEIDFEAKHVAQIEDYTLFTNSESLIKSIIGSFKDGNTLQNDINFSSLLKRLSNVNSGIWITKTESLYDKEKRKKSNYKFKFEKFPLLAIQWINDVNFAHIHVRFGKKQPKTNKSNITNVAEFVTDSDISLSPQWLKNHRTKGYDIALQDEKNILYLYSNTGKLYWKKQLNGKIIGKISQVDLYKNKRLQMAFRTKNRFIIIDRNGNIVKPFDIKIDGDENSQPLAVFDYDKNRNYRFLLNQKKNLIMLDRKGKKVKGFKFTKTKEPLSFPPKHVRIKGKDYIVLQLQNEDIKILNRRGEVVVKINSNITRSNNPIWQYLNTFTTSDRQGNLVQIDTKGNIIKSPEGWSENHLLEMTTKTLVSMSENTLTIKGIPLKLPYGNYTRPKIFYIKNELLISITDRDAQKVYLFSSNGNQINGFPIYGIQDADIIGNKDDDSLALIVQSESNGFIIYKIN